MHKEEIYKAVGDHIKSLHSDNLALIQEFKETVNTTATNAITIGNYLLSVPKKQRQSFIDTFLSDLPQTVVNNYLTIARTHKSRPIPQIDRTFFKLLGIVEPKLSKYANSRPKRPVAPKWMVWTNKLNSFLNTVDKESLTKEEVNIISEQFKTIIDFSKKGR